MHVVLLKHGEVSLVWGLSGWLTTLLQCFDTVGWVIRPVKRRLQNDLNTVSSGTLNVAQSINQAATTPFAKLLSPLILLSTCYCDIIIDLILIIITVLLLVGQVQKLMHIMCFVWGYENCRNVFMVCRSVIELALSKSRSSPSAAAINIETDIWLSSDSRSVICWGINWVQYTT